MSNHVSISFSSVLDSFRIGPLYQKMNEKANFMNFMQGNVTMEKLHLINLEKSLKSKFMVKIEG